MPAPVAFAALVVVVEYIASGSVAEYIEAAHAVSVSPAPVVEQLRSGACRVSHSAAVLESPVPVVRYIVPEPSVPDLPAPVLECSESAPTVSYMTPAPTVYRVMEGSMTEDRYRSRGVRACGADRHEALWHHLLAASGGVPRTNSWRDLEHLDNSGRARLRQHQ